MDYINSYNYSGQQWCNNRNRNGIGHSDMKKGEVYNGYRF